MTPAKAIAKLAAIGLPADRLEEAALIIEAVAAGALVEATHHIDEFRARERERKQRWRDARKETDRDGTGRLGDGTETGQDVSETDKASAGSPSSFPSTPSLSSPSPKPQGERASRGCRIPEDFVPHRNIRELALNRGLTDAEYTDQIERMKDHFGSKSGKDATKTNWDQAARNWIKRAADDKLRRPSYGQRRQTPGQDMRDAIDRVGKMVDPDYDPSTRSIS